MANNNKAIIPRPKNNLAKLPVAAASKPNAPSRTPAMQPKQQRNNSNKKKNNNKNKAAAASADSTDSSQQQPKQLANKKQDWKNNKPSSKQPNNNSPSVYPRHPQQQQQQQQQQQRRLVMPVKARRVERRKDIASMTDALHKSQVDILSTSPVSSSGESENDSDSGFQSRRRNRRSSNDGQVYCGPCFSNAPAPSALPMPPAFSRHLDHDGMFVMDDLQQQSKELMSLLVPRHRPSTTATPPAAAAATPSTTNTTFDYYYHQHPSTSVPPRMKTAHSLDADLSEIQRGLRSMLKMSS
ncbi:hypothetical protein BDB00DRAFT_788212 [Zychaea mexicana]|uniref:uncharacterized protein n=1 Tax=Zychaea mexicana TaxID=64656 RepID=UPI0022FE9FE7|nr:uncharacterized protein BDB00DRAFT_788212 [Zychaea mexicana]KAI9493164.1 hypothetical protein BDB00DRAFT_788212 [Zychaea mexicana]